MENDNAKTVVEQLGEKRKVLLEVLEKISQYDISTDIPDQLRAKRITLEDEIHALENAALPRGVAKEKPSCFVIMPFREPFSEYYRAIIKPAVESIGFNVIRADEIYHPTAFVQTIWDCILDADVVIAEMTSVNPNVLYELGLCHAINRVVVMITQKIEDVPADLRHINLIRYDVARVNWVEELKSAIQKMIVQGVPQVNSRQPYLRPVAIPETQLEALRLNLLDLEAGNKKIGRENIRLTSDLFQSHRQVERLQAQNKSLSLSVATNNKVIISEIEGETNTYLVPLRETGLVIELVKVPEGKFVYGNGQQAETIYLPDFYIGKYAVTNQQFTAFLNEKGNQTEDGASWINLDGTSPVDKCRIFVENERYLVEKGFENHPVTYVNWYGANAFCQWANMELPSDKQWEKAARGPNGFLFPWGNHPPTTELTNYDFDHWPRDIAPVEVNKYELGTSPYGCYQMIGNVWHWTSTYYPERQVQAVRGGSFLDYRIGFRSVYRFLVSPNGPDFSQSFVVFKRWLD